ncbi:hypothetical protein BLJAPNOD_00850 [Ensifer sp. M14]|uniref:hypothetical protein n=1 Tax=Ensifer sp. M14 TaxID=2203782 RepID=UPI000E1E028F|nr:hypothetical protein [Ensifer sp. M14]RDL49742.1 hypothetical protein BLJAPNOD_00850 [Ensifer sp. M14]
MENRKISRQRPGKKRRTPKVSLKATLPTRLTAIADTVDQLGAPQEFASKLEALRENFAAIRSGYRKDLRRQLAAAYDLATFLQDDNSAWIEFCRLDTWENVRSRPRDTDPTNALAYVLRFAVGFSGRAATKKASKYLSALSGFLSEGVPPAEIERKIREGGGIEKLARADAALRKQAEKKGDDEAKETPEITLKLRGEKVRRLLEVEGALPIGLKIRKMKTKGATVSARLISVKVRQPKHAS